MTLVLLWVIALGLSSLAFVTVLVVQAVAALVRSPRAEVAIPEPVTG